MGKLSLFWTLLGSICIFNPSLWAAHQEPDTTTISIPEYVITAQRSRSPNIDRPESISKLYSIDPQLITSSSAADVLSTVPGVWMQRTNLGGGSPFLRGLTGYHTLILIDGIRLNNSTFRSGPNQYLNTVDPFIMDNIEVMRGQGSVPYGSDALGGVVQIFTKETEFTDTGKRFKASTYGKFMNRGMENISRLELEASSVNSAISLGASFKKFGDIIPGKGLSKLSPTGYSENSLDFKFRQRIASKHILTGAFQHQKQNDVPLYHKIASGDYSRYQFDPQQRILSYLRLESNYESLVFSKITYLLSYQNSLEKRVKQKMASSVTNIEEDKVSTISGILEVLSEPTSFWTIASGLEIYQDNIRSKATYDNETTNQTTEVRGLYPDQSRSENIALFSLHSIDLKRLTIVYGGRYNLIRLSVPDEQLGQVEITPGALIGNAGMNYKISQNLRFVSSISSGFRAPNINDVSSLGIADFRYEIPNYELEPEKSINLDIGMKIDFPRLSADIFFYKNKLQNLITNVRTTYLGNDSIDGFQVYQRTNLNKALIQGFEATVSYSLTSFLKFISNISYTHGQDLQTKAPLRRIPPLNSRLSTCYTRKRFSGIIQWVYAGNQTRLSDGDIDDDRIQDGGTPSWNTLDISIGYSQSFFEVNAGIQNVLNEAYRYHGSGIDGRGRSFWISLKLFNTWYTK